MSQPKATNDVKKGEQRPLFNESPTRSDAFPATGSFETYSFEQGLDAAGLGLYQYLLLLYVGFAWICDAMEMMLLSFLAPAADCEWNLSAAQKGAITSVVFIGMCFGAYIWGMLADTEGRKIGFLATAVFTAVWGFASAASPSYASLLVFRGFVGLGLGGICVAFSLFIEFIPTASRGRYAILLQGFWTIGALLEAGIAWAFLPRLGWRYLLGISTFPLVILLLFYPFLSESPRFLALKGKTEKAQRVLQRVADWNGRKLPNGRLVTHNRASSNLGPKNGNYHAKKIAKGMLSGFEELFSSSLKHTTVLLFIIWFVNALIYYGLVLLTTELQSNDAKKCDADGDLELEDSEYLEIFIDTFAESVGFTFALFLIDTWGRRASMTAFLCVCGMTMWPLVLSDNDVFQTIFLFAARAAIVGSFNVLYVYTPELFPTDVRAFGLGLCNALSRIGGLIAPLFAVQLVDSGHETVVEIIFAVLCIVAGVASYNIPRETKGKELKDTVRDTVEEDVQETVPEARGKELQDTARDIEMVKQPTHNPLDDETASRL